MKKYLFLILLVFCITIVILGNYVMSVRTTLKDQSLNSKTKESSEIYTSNTLLGTEEKLTDNKINSENLEENVQNSNETSNEDLIQNSSESSQDVEKQNLNSNENLIQNEIPKTNENQEQILQNIVQPLENEKNDEVVDTNVQNNNVSTNTTTIAQQVQPVKSNYSFLLTPENVTADILNSAENEIGVLPQNVVNAFNRDGWSINITNDNIASKYFGGSYSNVMGATKMDSKQIIIQNKKSCVQSSVVHEMGHYIDWHFNFPSLSDEFWEIYTQEIGTFKSRIPNSSAIRDEMEFFAHTFYYSVKDPSKCTPMALQFVRNYVNNM